MRLGLILFAFIFLLAACDDGNAESSTDMKSEQTSEPQEVTEEETIEEVDTKPDEIETQEKENELSTDIRFTGRMKLTEEGIEVDVDSNLPEGVEAAILAYIDPYGGHVVSQVAANESLTVGEDGKIQGTVPFDDDDFVERHLNEPIELEIRFNPEYNISFLAENREELEALFGEKGIHLEGPFLVETQQYSHDTEPSFHISASVIGPAKSEEIFTIEEPVIGEPPEDYGDTNVWMEAEIVDIDHRYVYVEGRSNLLYGLILFGNIKSSEERLHYQNVFTYKTTVKRDGTFTMPIAYKSITDEGFIRIHTHAGSNHPRGQAARNIYGGEFEHLQGDIVKQRYEGQSEQMIELIIPLNPEYEDTPEDIDVTKDGDEMKLILSDEILFEFGKSDISSEGDRLIQEVADWLENKEYSGLIKIYGHTDNVDGDDINQPLSEDRAENVNELLQSFLKDTSDYEFEVKGFGKYEPIATNETEEGRERNRRVEILLQTESPTYE